MNDDDVRLETTIRLLTAIEREDLAQCKKAIRQGALMDTERDEPTLCALVHFHEPELLELAVGAGAAVNANDSTGKTALYWAVATQDLPAVRVLVNAGATVQAERLEDGYTSVHCAAEDGSSDILRLLIERADGKTAFSVCDYIGRTPLAAAAHKGKLETVRVLIRAGHDLDDACDHVIGNPPIRRAAHGGFLDVVRELLEAGADPLRTGWMQLDALYEAEWRQDQEMMTLLRNAVQARSQDAQPKRAVSRKVDRKR